MQFVLNAELPPSPLPASAFDLVYAISVFSHLTDHWATWLLDIHRVLKSGGLLIATFMGEGMIERIAGEPWEDSKIGMACYFPGHGWDGGGPMVLLSPWWIEEHWGRLFHIDRVLPRGFGGGHPIFGVHDHGVVIAHKDGRAPVTAEELNRRGDDPRECSALEHEVTQLRLDAATLRGRLERGEMDGRDALRAVGRAVRRRLGR
jgi:hypothetical protein